jgi:glycosyltransferase involved in cell wall biosynthesis
MRVAIITDAWRPQVNGVVTTLGKMGEFLESQDHDVRFITPQDFKTIPCPTYPEIRLAIFPRRKIDKLLADFLPAHIHIATEGPIGHAARAYCMKKGLQFTTSFHTQFAEYLRLRAPIPINWTYKYLRRFHGAAVRTMVPTPSIKERLESHGFKNVVVWSRGVNVDVFKPDNSVDLEMPGPIMVYMGRVAVEKNIEAFLDLDLPGSKLVIGDGPDREKLQKKYVKARFVGAKFGRDLASWVAAGDVFVFPSKTDTFGLVMLEAMGCGVPVAAYPVTGPIDVIKQGQTGYMHEDLSVAISEALKLDKQTCIDYAQLHTWDHCGRRFESLLTPV